MCSYLMCEKRLTFPFIFFGDGGEDDTDTGIIGCFIDGADDIFADLLLLFLLLLYHFSKLFLLDDYFYAHIIVLGKRKKET